MKTPILLSLVVLLFSCGKDDTPTDNKGTTPGSDKKCVILESVSFDQNGNEVGRINNYYTDNRLDSVYTYSQGQLTSKTIHTYIQADKRKTQSYNADGSKQPGYYVYTLDEHGNVLVMEGYDKDDNLVYKSTAQYTYKCD